MRAASCACRVLLLLFCALLLFFVVVAVEVLGLRKQNKFVARGHYCCSAVVVCSSRRVVVPSFFPLSQIDGNHEDDSGEAASANPRPSGCNCGLLVAIDQHPWQHASLGSLCFTQSLLIFCSVSARLSPPLHNTTRNMNSRAAAVESSQGKRVAAHGAGRRQLPRGSGAGGPVRGVLLPQAGQGAQPGCQRQR